MEHPGKSPLSSLVAFGSDVAHPTCSVRAFFPVLRDFPSYNSITGVKTNSVSEEDESSVSALIY